MRNISGLKPNECGVLLAGDKIDISKGILFGGDVAGIILPDMQVSYI